MFGFRSLKMSRRASSIQSMSFHQAYSVEELAYIYFAWLPSNFSGLIGVKMKDLSMVEICFFNLTLLALKRIPENKGVFFQVVGGLLSRQTGTFSFEIDQGKLVTALRDFSPRLFWPIYRITQYPFHELVMFLYSQHLKTLR